MADRLAETLSILLKAPLGLSQWTPAKEIAAAFNSSNHVSNFIRKWLATALGASVVALFTTGFIALGSCAMAWLMMAAELSITSAMLQLSF